MNRMLSYFVTLLSFIFVSFLIFSCEDNSIAEETVDQPNQEEDPFYFPPVVSSSSVWETTTPESLDFRIENIEELYTFLKNTNTEAFLLLVNGRIVLEQYFNGSSQNDFHFWFSAGKTLTAMTTLIAEEQNFLDINESSTTYLGNAWADISLEQMENIQIKHHLTMSTGLNYQVEDLFCTRADCFTYLNPPDSYWYYHNSTYTIMERLLSEAIPQGFRDYFTTELKNKIGMDGVWYVTESSFGYTSTARSMARFGLLNLNKGVWENQTILNPERFAELITPSQSMNPSYGYLYWLNGQNSYKLPGSQLTFQGSLIANAPQDLFAGMGKDDQKLYVIPSKKMVIIRLGGNTGLETLGPSGFDTTFWDKLNAVID